jgi:hypothetical protein
LRPKVGAKASRQIREHLRRARARYRAVGHSGLVRLELVSARLPFPKKSTSGAVAVL